MRVLLVAYDFPPIRSPRALRWRYLARELALLGHDVHVLMPDHGATDVEFPRVPGAVTLHKTFAGPFGWLAARKSHGSQPSASASQPIAASAAAVPHLNWKGRVVDAAKRIAGCLLFPDVRREWNLWAGKALETLLTEIQPDVVVSSHEPASTLLLGLQAKRRGFKWVADLGDPVCAAYTPQRWQRKANALEAEVMRHADHVLVTNAATRDLLSQRHGSNPECCTVLPNGYDDRRGTNQAMSPDISFDDRLLELFYAGRLYGYRDPAPLLQAVLQTPGVRLTLLVPDLPEQMVAELAEGRGERLRVFSPMPHATVMALVEQADVLVNLGDHGQPERTPAKLFEYLGVPRPLLHVCEAGSRDAVQDVLKGLSRGWTCGADIEQLKQMLERLRELKAAGRLDEGLELAPVRKYAHSYLGGELERVLANTINPQRRPLT